MTLADLLKCEAIEKIEVFPLKNKDGTEFYYKIKELTIAEENAVKSNAINITNADFKAENLDHDSKNEILKSIYNEAYNNNYYLLIILKTTYDCDTNKPVFDSIKSIKSLNLHRDVFSKLVENYENFVLEKSPYYYIKNEDINQAIDTLKNEFSESFLDNCVKSYTKRDLKIMISFLLQALNLNKNQKC